MAEYIFGGNTGMTQEELAQRRREEIAQRRRIAASLARGSGAPRNVGEGLNRIGEAIAYRMMMNQNRRGEQQLSQMAAVDQAGPIDFETFAASRASVPDDAVLSGGAGSDMLLGGSGGDMMAMPQDPATMRPHDMANTMGGYEALGRSTGVTPVVGQPPMEYTPEMSASPGMIPDAGPQAPGTFGGYDDGLRPQPYTTDPMGEAPIPPVPEWVLDDGHGGLGMTPRRERQPVDGKRVMRQDEAFTPERLEEEGPPPTMDEIAQMAQSVGIPQEALRGLDLNATEARNAGYLLRMMEAENTIRELQDSNRFGQRLLEFLPNDLEALTMDPDYRRYMLARENFNEAALRSATGATINNSEMPTQRRNYFPSPYDDDETRAFLERQRQALLMALQASSGGLGALVPQFGQPVVPRQSEGAATHRFNLATGQIEAIQ